MINKYISKLTNQFNEHFKYIMRLHVVEAQLLPSSGSFSSRILTFRGYVRIKDMSGTNCNLPKLCITTSVANDCLCMNMTVLLLNKF